jgi:hypothetical protein
MGGVHLLQPSCLKKPLSLELLAAEFGKFPSLAFGLSEFTGTASDNFFEDDRVEPGFLGSVD